MKKYLLTSAAALAFCGLFTSCTHDLDYDGEAAAAQNSVMKTYEQAFITAFGQPDPNQEWGFGSKNSSTRAFTRAVGTYSNYKGSLEPVNVSFPEDTKDASKFLAKVPDEIQKLPADGNVNGGSWYINNTTTAVNMYTTPGAIYVNGDVDFTSKNFEIKEGSEIYIPSGSRLKLDAKSSNQLKATIYIASGATLETDGELKIDNTGKVYNHGAIICSRFEVNNTAFLYNVGTLTSSGDVYIANSTSRIVNDGTITAASTHVEGSGALQNNAEWTVTGNTVVNCNVGGWVNNGHWTTQNYHYTAGSNNVINNCFLKVTNEFNINMSSASSENGFKIDSNGGVETVNFNGGKAGSDPNSKSGPYKVIMGHKSLFKVTGTATLDGGNKGWGFYGPADGEYAVFQAKNVVRAAGLENNQGAVTYGGNLYVSAETHFAQGNDGNPNNLFIYEEGGFSVNTNIYAPGFQSGTPDIAIATTPCNPGFNDRDDDDPNAIRVICEDLSVTQASDWDFNDAVFDVKFKNGDNSQIEITLRAAGGTLPLYIAGNEVHKLFKKENPTLDITSGTMVSTGKTNSKGKYRYTKLDGIKAPKFTIDNNFNTNNVKEIAKAIPVQVVKLVNGEKRMVDIPWQKGAPSARIGVGTDYNWCDETVDIRNWFTASSATSSGDTYSTFQMYVDGDLTESEGENAWYNVKVIE